MIYFNAMLKELDRLFQRFLHRTNLFISNFYSDRVESPAVKEVQRIIII